jgi:hypothetical protein
MNVFFPSATAAPSSIIAPSSGGLKFAQHMTASQSRTACKSACPIRYARPGGCSAAVFAPSALSTNGSKTVAPTFSNAATSSGRTRARLGDGPGRKRPSQVDRLSYHHHALPVKRRVKRRTSSTGTSTEYVYATRARTRARAVRMTH